MRCKGVSNILRATQRQAQDECNCKFGKHRGEKPEQNPVLMIVKALVWAQAVFRLLMILSSVMPTASTMSWDNEGRLLSEAAGYIFICS